MLQLSEDFRARDVRHSQSYITKASLKLSFKPDYLILDKFAKAMP